MALAVPSPTSRLFSDSILLSGHKAAVLNCKFSPDGRLLASVSQDKSLLLWDVFHPQCRCLGALTGHRNAITDLFWSVVDDSKVITSSADRSLGIFDLNEWQRVKKLQGHTGIVNTCYGSVRGSQVLISGSDDCTVKLWDPREKGCTQSWPILVPVTAVCMDEFGTSAYVGSIDSSIQVWDMRTNSLRELLRGHTDSITGLAFSQDGSYLLSNSTDQTMRCWDVRPFVQGARYLKLYEGVPHSYDKGLLRCAWSSDNLVVSAGSSDRLVHLWDSSTRQKTKALTGHNGTVYAVEFHPEGKIVASCSADSYLVVGYY